MGCWRWIVQRPKTQWLWPVGDECSALRWPCRCWTRSLGSVVLLRKVLAAIQAKIICEQFSIMWLQHTQLLTCRTSWNVWNIPDIPGDHMWPCNTWYTSCVFPPSVVPRGGGTGQVQEPLRQIFKDNLKSSNTSGGHLFKLKKKIHHLWVDCCPVKGLKMQLKPDAETVYFLKKCSFWASWCPEPKHRTATVKDMALVVLWRIRKRLQVKSEVQSNISYHNICFARTSSASLSEQSRVLKLCNIWFNDLPSPTATSMSTACPPKCRDRKTILAHHNPAKRKDINCLHGSLQIQGTKHFPFFTRWNFANFKTYQYGRTLLFLWTGPRSENGAHAALRHRAWHKQLTKQNFSTLCWVKSMPRCWHLKTRSSSSKANLLHFFQINKTRSC